MRRGCDEGGCHAVGRAARARVRIALPGICIQDGIADVFVSGAVELLPAAFGDDADLAAGSAAVFRGVIGSENLDFLRRVHVGRAQTGAVGARARSRSAIIGNQVLGIARPVDVRWSLAEGEAEVRKRAATSSGNQVGHEDRVASVDFKRVNLLPGDQLLHAGRFRLQRDNARHHLHRLRGRAQRQRRIQAQMSARVKLVVCGFILLKTRGLRAHGVQAGRNVRDGIVAGIVRRGLTFDAGLVLDRDLGVRNGCAGLVFDEA